jgi:ectoine hydroxylase-related dioxygenase (phytanoyl-CoA dioxygenase family)
LETDYNYVHDAPSSNSPLASAVCAQVLASMMQVVEPADAFPGLSPPAAKDISGPRLSEDQLTALRQDGFLLVHGMADAEQIALLRSLYDRLFTERRGWDKGDLFDMVGRDNPGEGLALPQMLWPSRYEPLLGQSQLAGRARHVAEQILGAKLENMLEHAILKPASHGAPTPWHQDEAFNRKGSGFEESISIWMPLQDVTVESGCMRYIRGSNRGPLFPHRSPNNDPRIHGLETVSTPDLTNCVEVPMPAGSGVIHLSRTLHSAGPNTSGQPRRAYILGYAVKSHRHQLLTRDYAWNLEKQTAREQRELQSLPRLKRVVRRIRRFVRGQKF